MQGVVLCLDEANHTRVQGLAESLEQFGGRPATIGLPHLTLHAAKQYDIEKVNKRVLSLGRSLPPVTLTSTGIGVFPGEKTYVYLTVVRNPRLALLQRTTYEEIRLLGTGSEPVWAPDRWVPHITLAQFERGARVGEAVQHLLSKDVHFECVVNEISVIEGEPTARVITSAPFDA